MTTSEVLAKKSYWLHKPELDRYERAMGYYARRTDGLVLDQLIDEGSGIALDVPCGTGRFTHLLAGKGYRVVLGDYGDSMLRIAKGRTGTSGVRCDAFRLPFPGSVFDLIVCMRLMFHYEEGHRLLSELVRVAKPGGVIVFDSLNRFSLRHAVERLLNLVLARAGRRVWFTSPRYWQRVAQEMKCQIVASEARYLLPTRAYRMFPGFAHGGLRILDRFWPASVRVLRYWKLKKGSAAQRLKSSVTARTSTLTKSTGIF